MELVLRVLRTTSCGPSDGRRRELRNRFVTPCHRPLCRCPFIHATVRTTRTQHQLGRNRCLLPCASNSIRCSIVQARWPSRTIACKFEEPQILQCSFSFERHTDDLSPFEFVVCRSISAHVCISLCARQRYIADLLNHRIVVTSITGECVASGMHGIWEGGGRRSHGGPHG